MLPRSMLPNSMLPRSMLLLSNPAENLLATIGPYPNMSIGVTLMAIIDAMAGSLQVPIS